MRSKKKSEPHTKVGMSLLKFNFVAGYEEFQEHFAGEVADHFYDDVHQVHHAVSKTIQLFTNTDKERD
jgi:hypothetical protein